MTTAEATHECSGNREQVCLDCTIPLECRNDYSGGGSHYWELHCPRCKERYTYDTYGFELTRWSMNTHDSTAASIGPELIKKMAGSAVATGLCMRPVLITGASGFVGRALAQKLLDDGRIVVSMVRDRTRTLPPGSAFVFGDVTDEDFCRRVIADYEIGTIYHLAAQAIVSACAEDPLTALNVAVMGTARLLNAAKESGRPIRVIVSTSDKVFGSAPTPYTEETPLDARHAYEVSKACQDLVARMFANTYGLDVRVVRAVNIYGPGDPNESRLIPQTALRLLRGGRPLVHAGADGMRRQYVYIDDLVRALLTVCEHGKSGEAYCVGSPDAPMSVLDVIRVLQVQAGKEWVPPEIRDRDSRFHEIASQAVCDDKLQALGWQPEVSFGNGIARTLEWYCARKA